MTNDKIQQAVENILEIDPWLDNYQYDLRLRMSNYYKKREEILGQDESIEDFASAHHYYGFHKEEDSWVYREWAPAADKLYLTGDFNNWNPHSLPMRRLENGNWEIRLKDPDCLHHKDQVKVIVNYDGEDHYKLPTYIHYVTQEKNHEGQVAWQARIWDPEEDFPWTDQTFLFKGDTPPLIYESHVGIAQEEERIGTYREFADKILPRIKADGYNAVQLMGIIQHPYYGSFGYHVCNFFAASSWFGEPDDLKYLINRAHRMGIAVFMDLVHSHAAKNTNEGINHFDGTQEQFFYPGDRGFHRQWDSMCFDYSKPEVLRFLLSNLAYWMEEFHFDGFRFDGITSMLYWNHGLGINFDSYDKYFSLNTNTDAVTYLMLASELVHKKDENMVLIAEDMSGMPGLCLPIEDCGMGFDYRLAMGVPDMWIRNMKKNDYDWDVYEIYHELTTRRPLEKKIAYAESHDQALVGDKTLFFWMADQEAYWHMNIDDPNYIIDRAMALHKMIRLITISTGSDGYLNFMGNEFGHPEWIDFPRLENNWSYKYARRQWHLADDKNLRYNQLLKFDNAMIKFVRKSKIMGPQALQLLWLDNDQKIIAFRNTNYVFLFNFHPTQSIVGFQLPIHEDGIYKVVLSTDNPAFGGFGHVDESVEYYTRSLAQADFAHGIIIYIPARTALVLKKVASHEEKEERKMEDQDAVEQMIHAERLAQKTLQEKENK